MEEIMINETIYVKITNIKLVTDKLQYIRL